ncbi:MAG: hypothetical protein ACRDF9_13340 [Candidatus Limnocylindria bacterium]
MIAASSSRSFERSAGATAIVVGIGGLLYSVAFVIVSRSAPDTGRFLSSLFLLLGGVLGIHVMAALYRRLRDVDAGFALVGFMFGFAGALGSTVHGAFDLANFFHAPAALASDVPNAVDPRGILTFGLSGLAVLVIARLMSRDGRFPARLALLGYVSGVLLVLIYLGRLIVLDPASPLILGPAALEGFIVNPVWYVWLGWTFLRGPQS